MEAMALMESLVAPVGRFCSSGGGKKEYPCDMDGVVPSGLWRVLSRSWFSELLRSGLLGNNWGRGYKEGGKRLGKPGARAWKGEEKGRVAGCGREGK
uniref:Uncharacterized protein n=1 Tax=Callorhinchus milii TaxID=7868 RepID=A0A4W3GWQ5_CALMI